MTTPCGPEGRSSRGFGKMSLSDYSCKQFLGDQPHALGTAALQLERMAMLWRTMWTWTTTFAVLTALATAMGCVNAQAQLWPQRPVRVIAPYAARGNSDGMPRIVAQRLTDAFGQTFVVENRLGANGAIATEAVARSPADGYTLLWGATPPLTINPALTKVNPIKDFAPISVVAVNAFVLVVNKSFPPKTVAEFIAHVRAQRNKLAYAEGSAGSLTHLTMALFLKRAGLQMTNVSYRGNAPALTDVVAGHLTHHVLERFRRHAAGYRRLDPTSRRFKQRARAAAARCADCRRIRLSRVRRAHLEWADGADGNAQGHHRQDRRRDRPPRHTSAIRRAPGPVWGRSAGQYACGVQRHARCRYRLVGGHHPVARTEVLRCRQRNVPYWLPAVGRSDASPHWRWRARVSRCTC